MSIIWYMHKAKRVRGSDFDILPWHTHINYIKRDNVDSLAIISNWDYNPCSRTVAACAKFYKVTELPNRIFNYSTHFGIYKKLYGSPILIIRKSTSARLLTGFEIRVDPHSSRVINWAAFSTAHTVVNLSLVFIFNR